MHIERELANEVPFESPNVVVPWGLLPEELVAAMWPAHLIATGLDGFLLMECRFFGLSLGATFHFPPRLSQGRLTEIDFRGFFPNVQGREVEVPSIPEVSEFVIRHFTRTFGEAEDRAARRPCEGILIDRVWEGPSVEARYCVVERHGWDKLFTIRSKRPRR